MQTGTIKFYSAALISFLIWSWTVFLTTFAFSGHSNWKLCPVKGADTLKISFVKKPRAYWKRIFCKEEPRALQSLIVIESDVKCCTLSFKLSINSIDIGHNSLYIMLRNSHLKTNQNMIYQMLGGMWILTLTKLHNSSRDQKKLDKIQ